MQLAQMLPDGHSGTNLSANELSGIGCEAATQLTYLHAQGTTVTNPEVIALANGLRRYANRSRQTPKVVAIQLLCRRVATNPIPIGSFAAQLAAIAEPEPIRVRPMCLLLRYLAVIVAVAGALGFTIGLRAFQ